MTLHEINLATAKDSSPRNFLLACQVLHLRETVTKTGKPYLELEISDGTGTEKFKIWEDNEAFVACRSLQEGDGIELDGTFWRNPYGLNLDRFRLRWLEPSELQDLFAGSPEHRAALEQDWRDLNAIIDALVEPRLRGLAQMFLREWGDKFRRAAAARDYHHARRGGLLAHTAQMMRASSALASVYPQLNWDLIQTGILFHDCGKLWELDYPAQGFVCPVTPRGELLGHITMGIELVNKIWRTLEAQLEFLDPVHPPREAVREHLLHLIAAHHGLKEYGAPVTPRTPEAWMLHHIDNMDAYQEMVRQTYLEKAQIAPGIYDHRRPLEGRMVAPLPKFVLQPEPPSTE